MPDVFTKKKRSEVMSRIRSRGNKNTELRLIKVFRVQRITGWRRHLSLSLKVSGSQFPVQGDQSRVRPDFVFRKLRVAVFVDGCFWHACPLHTTKPKGNAAFWRKKFAANQARDRLVTCALRRHGWRVLRIWEHELMRKNEARLVRRLRRFFDV